MRVKSAIGSVAMLFAVGVSQQGDSRALGQNTKAALTPRAALLPVAIRIDLSQKKGKLRPTWRFFGADEPNYAYMKDGKKLLAELGQLDQRPKL
jgi:hypothetical protein